MDAWSQAGFFLGSTDRDVRREQRVQFGLVWPGRRVGPICCVRRRAI